MNGPSTSVVRHFVNWRSAGQSTTRPTVQIHGFSDGVPVAPVRGRSMLKIQRTANGDVVFTVSGRVEAQNISELSDLLNGEQGGRTLVLDLKDVVLVDGDVVRFLRTCVGDGIVLRNCPPYIKAWMAREGERS